jgi:hypothetical protein
MSAALLAAALVVASGSIAALASADARLGLVGLAAALAAAGLLADPLPSPAIVGVRLTAALLVVTLLRTAGPPAVARHPATEAETGRQAHLGWPAETLLGLAGAVAGIAIAAGLASFAPVTGSDAGTAAPLTIASLLSPAALALGLAGLIAAIAAPALVSGVGLRRATAAVLLVEGVFLARIGLAGPPAVLEEVVLAALLSAVAAAAGLIAAAGRAAPEGGLRQA